MVNNSMQCNKFKYLLLPNLGFIIVVWGLFFPNLGFVTVVWGLLFPNLVFII